jgi:hypothetical protein
VINNNEFCTGEESELVDCIGFISESIQYDNHICERNSTAGVACITLVDSKTNSRLQSKIVGAAIGSLFFVGAVIVAVLILKWRITRKVINIILLCT